MEEAKNAINIYIFRLILSFFGEALCVLLAIRIAYMDDFAIKIVIENSLEKNHSLNWLLLLRGRLASFLSRVMLGGIIIKLSQEVKFLGILKGAVSLINEKVNKSIKGVKRKMVCC